MNAVLKAAVIGVGRVGSRFDEERERKAVWSHVGAYLALPGQFRLVGVCEIDVENASRFRARCPDVPVFADVRELVRAVRPDVVSICTPMAGHAPALMAALEAGPPRAAWCEKPLADQLGVARAMVAGCEARRIPLLVSHVRRWHPLWRRFKAIVDQGLIGSLQSLRVAMPNRLWSIGSHAIDLLSWLGGEILRVRGLRLLRLEQDGEPAVGAVLSFASGAVGYLHVTGAKENLIVEAEAIGDRGRAIASELDGAIRIQRFEPSARYRDYNDLGTATVETIPSDETASPFVAMAKELAELASGTRSHATCSGADALAVQGTLGELAAEPS